MRGAFSPSYAITISIRSMHMLAVTRDDETNLFT